MRLLVLGGTSWLGGAVASHAVEAGHDVTCLARGESGPVPAGATLVSADRWEPSAYDDLRDFDAAIEVSWQPDLVVSALRHIVAAHWVYVSSVSVYAETATVSEGSSGHLLPAWVGTGEVGKGEYGEAKVACEAAYAAELPTESFAIARAGLIGGYGDLSDRLGYWPARVAGAVGDRERVLVPAPTVSPVQVIDVEDLATWLVHCAAEGIHGIYDAVGPQTSLQAVLDACAVAAGTTPSWGMASQRQLEAAGVRPWMGPESLPLWTGDPEAALFMTRSTAAAESAGLVLRPVEDTIANSVRWERERGIDRVRASGLSAERETSVLQSL